MDELMKVNWGTKKVAYFLKKLSIFLLFLSLPVVQSHQHNLSFELSLVFFLAYFVFICWQSYLLSREIEHRLRIYPRANSSMDRILARILMGSSLIMVYCSFLSVFSGKVADVLYWSVWLMWLIWLSWPTKKKIIESRISNEFSEFKFLDGFEKTTLFLGLLTFVVSLPHIPQFNSFDAARLYIDPDEYLHSNIWDFIYYIYFFAGKQSKETVLQIFFHFYFYFFSISMLSLYSLFRYFFSRRVSILGIYAFISTWSFSLILEHGFNEIFLTNLGIVWLWLTIWAIRSSSYRSGLLIGIANYWFCTVNPQMIYLYFIQLALVFYFMKNEKTKWFMRQFFKYNLLGMILSLFVVLSHSQAALLWFNGDILAVLNGIGVILSRKSFYYIAPIGLLYLFVSRFNFKNLKGKESHHYRFCLTLILILVTWGVFFDRYIVQSFGAISLLVFFALLPLEELFDRLNALRSKKNLIYLVYIMICLLDSHFEGRVKIFLENFKN
ncbi:MAG: hypothetical protein H6621_06110 [Halobacteriovoraceae bacterium]|nr:hypothetical protein [Halobacteriovoraceae bacterium]